MRQGQWCNLCKSAPQRQGSGRVRAHEDAPRLCVGVCSFPQQMAHDFFHLQQSNVLDNISSAGPERMQRSAICATLWRMRRETPRRPRRP